LDDSFKVERQLRLRWVIDPSARTIPSRPRCRRMATPKICP